MNENMNEKMTFEQAMDQLENALKVLSQGDIALEQAVEQYKRGLDMANLCQKMLRDAESEIKILQDGIEKEFQIEEQLV
ncbi:MAG: exodeoxyribonuclease VII small subunit [Peptococcaceae bacterium]|jgi:exodeoxyribonuclease VII small subunit|nr:exodeoxyribonuclease VII small subunit [Peptococcaceae bacterium]